MVARGRLHPALVIAVAAGLAVCAAFATLLAYVLSPVIGLAAIVALALASAVILRPMIGVLTGILAVALEVLNIHVGSIGLSPTEALLLVTAVGVVLHLMLGGRLRPSAYFVAYAAGLLWIAAGLAVARDTFVVERTLVMWSAFGLVAFFVANSSAREVERVVYALAFAGAVTATIAIATGGVQVQQAGAAVVANRASGSFTHPNQLAFLLCLSLPPALVLAVRGRPGLRPAMLVAAGLIIAGIALTLTRGAIIGASVSLVVLLTWTPFRRLAVLLLCAFALYAAFNAQALSKSKELSLVTQRIATIRNKDTASVGNQRLRIWSTVPRIAADHPLFGVAVGNFKDVSLQYDLSEGGEAFEHAHNVLLTVLAEQGFVGLGLLLAALVAIARAAAQVLRRRASPRFPVGIAAIAGLTGLFVNSLTDYPPGSNPNMAFMLIVIGVLVATARHIAAEAPGPGDGREGPRP